VLPEIVADAASPNYVGYRCSYTRAMSGWRPMFCHRLSVAAGVLASLAVGGLLTGCSASSRVEDVVPSWANSPPPRAQHQDRREQRNSKPALERREQATVPPQPPQPPALEEWGGPQSRPNFSPGLNRARSPPHSPNPSRPFVWVAARPRTSATYGGICAQYDLARLVSRPPLTCIAESSGAVGRSPPPASGVNRLL